MVRRFLRVISEYPEPFVHYAHNAQYDWRYILPYLAEHEIPCEICMRTESDIYEIRISLGSVKIVMRDSFAFWNSSLEKLAKAYCPEFPKLPGPDFDKGEIFDPNNKEHEAYARRDAMILAVALPRLDTKMQKHFGVGIGVTTASTAVRAWQETLGNEIFACPPNDEFDKFVRSAYYGGLVFLTRNDRIGDGSEIVAETFDINSSYPAAMVEWGVPYGRVLVSNDYKEGHMGIYRVRVRAPENLIVPILPRRNDKGNMAWSRGEFETTCTNRELVFAANHGYEILEIIEGVYFEDTIYPFDDFIGKCKAIRFAYRDLPEEMLAKLMQNSLYGKFGSRRERMRIYHPESDDDYLEGEPLEACDYFWIKKEIAEEMKCLPQWAVFITAHARLRLLNAIYTCGPENVLYGDTDSITVLRGHGTSIDVGLEYGQFKLEKSWTEFRAIAPKVYAGRLADYRTKEGELVRGGMKGAAKGLPRKNLKPENWEQLLYDGRTSATALSLSSLRVALQKGASAAKELERVSSSLCNSANWELHGNLVRPKIAA